jgi:hypothetical protein
VKVLFSKMAIRTRFTLRTTLRYYFYVEFLYFYICASLSACAVHSMAVACDFLVSLFPGMLSVYFPSDFQIVPVFLKFIGKNFVLTFSAAMAQPSQRPATKNVCKTRGCIYSF